MSEDYYVSGDPDRDAILHELAAAERKVAAVEALADRWLRLSGQALDAEVREWTSAAGRTLRAALRGDA